MEVLHFRWRPNGAVRHVDIVFFFQCSLAGARAVPCHVVTIVLLGHFVSLGVCVGFKYQVLVNRGLRRLLYASGSYRPRGRDVNEQQGRVVRALCLVCVNHFVRWDVLRHVHVYRRFLCVWYVVPRCHGYRPRCFVHFPNGRRFTVARSWVNRGGRGVFFEVLGTAPTSVRAKVGVVVVFRAKGFTCFCPTAKHETWSICPCLLGHVPGG